MCCTQYARKLSPCIFDLYTEYKVQNARLDESQAGIKIAERNINNLRYADNTTLMAESEEELKSLLWKQCQTLFWGAPKTLQMVTAAMKLQDACSLEEKL